MARHSHFANMKRWKAVVDAERGKIFTVHARLIAVAAKNGGDPVMNPMLRSAIDHAKAANVPNANIMTFSISLSIHVRYALVK